MFSLSGYSADQAYYSWIFIAFLMSFRFKNRYGLLASAGYFYMCVSALRVFAAPSSPWIGEEPLWNTSFQLSAAATLMCATLALLAAPVMTRFLWTVIAVSNTAMLLCGTEGLLGNYSMSGCLSVSLMYFSPGAALFGIIGALVSRQIQPIGLLTLVLFFRLNKARCYKTAALMPLCLIVFAEIFARHGFFTTNGRYKFWTLAWEMFRAHINPWIGAGLGSFYYIGPILTRNTGVAMLALHSDWLQVGFETGMLGLVIAIALAAKNTLDSKGKLRNAYIVYCLFGAANFPLHNPITALLGAAFLFEIAQAKKSTPRPSYPASQRKRVRPFHRFFSMYTLESWRPWNVF